MAKDICAATGERIRKLRRAQNWRQIDLAEHSGVHEVHISDLERGTREPGLRTFVQAGNCRCVNAAALLSRPYRMLQIGAPGGN